MSITDPFTGAEPPTQETGTAAARSETVTGAEAFSAGQRWRNYQLNQPWENGAPGMFWGVEAGSLEKVILRNRPIGAAVAGRRLAWDRLQQMADPRLVRGVLAREENGRRIEVFRVPAGETLRRWAANHVLNDEVLARLTMQVAEALGALHAAGVVHLALSPDVIWVEGTARDFNLTVGGLHEATVYDQAGLIPVEVNPMVAPPEAAGLYQMAPGPRLGAWDWWSLGRVLQELLLGRKVYELLLKAEPGQLSLEHRGRAELMLLERDDSGRRAGAVEAMPAETSPFALALLRGLLTSCRDGRWQQTEVLRCLQREPVQDRYALPRDTRLYVWRRQAFLLPEAAAMFSDPSCWSEGEAVLFSTGADQDSLPEFLAEVPAYQAEHRQVQELLALMGLPAWADGAEAARRTAVAGLVWLALGREPGAGLHLRGWLVDEPGLHRYLAEEMPAESVALLRTVTDPAYLHALESLGGAASAMLLWQLAETGGEAIRRAVKHGWAEDSDESMQAQLYLLALESHDALAGRLANLRLDYAGNRDPELNSLMTEAKPARWAQALLGFMAKFPLDYGFVTHAEWNLRTYQSIRTEAEQLTTVLFWRRLYWVMLASPALLGSWPVYLLAWGVPLALALKARAWLEAALIVLLSLAWRWAGRWFLQEEIHHYAPGVLPWGWLDRPQRCREEAALAQPDGPVLPLRSLRQAWERLRARAEALPRASRPQPLRRPPWLIGLKAASVLGLLLVAGLSSWQTWPELLNRAEAMGLIHPLHVVQNQARPGDQRKEAAGAPAKPAPEEPLYEEINDGFGKRRRGPLIAWDLPPPEHPAPLAVRRVETMNAEQAAYALVSGSLLLEPYPHKDLRLILAIRVPVERAGDVGLVLYSSEKHELLDRRLFLLSAAPKSRTWYQVDNLRVVFLGEPAALRQQNSLAMR